MPGARLATIWMAVLAFVTLFVAALSLTNATMRLDRLALDSLSVWRAPAPDESTILVTIDQPSLTAIGRWPWSRDVHARMIERLNAAGAKLIVYDVLFVEPDAGDDALAAAMAAKGNVYLPLLFQQPGSDGRAADIVPPVETLASRAAGIGAAPIIFDDDGVVRHAKLAVDYQGKAVPHMMELVYRQLHGGKVSPAFARANDTGQTMLMPLSRSGQYRTVPFSAVLAGEVPKAFFDGKTVMVGATAEGMGDNYPVAWSAGSFMPGVEIQANMLDALGGGKLIRDVPIWLSTLISILPVMLLLTGFWYLRPRAAIRLAISVMLFWLIFVAALLIFAGWWLPPVPALIGLLIAYPLWGWRRLEALSNWVGVELRHMKRELGGILPLGDSHPTDRLGAEVDALDDAITALKRERRFSRDVLDASPDALLVEDLGGKIVFANEAADHIFGASVEGRQSIDVAGGSEFVPGDLSLPSPSGQQIVSVGMALFDDGGGRSLGRIIRLADVTAVRQAEKAREAVVRFLSHDMRAPQSAIIAILESPEGKALPPELRERLTRNARHTLDLADGFVRLAQAQSARMAEGEFDMADLMAEAGDIIWPIAKAAKVRIEVAKAAPRIAKGDAAMLMRAARLAPE